VESKYQELLIKIDGRIKELSYELENDNNTRTEYLSTFFEKCSLKDMSTIFNISSSELLLALLLEADRKTDANELIDKVKEVKDYIDHMAMDELINACGISSDKQISETLKRIEEAIQNLPKTNLLKFMSDKRVKDINKTLELKLSGYEEFLTFMKLLKLLEIIDKNENLYILLFIADIHQEKNNDINDYEKILSKSYDQTTINKILATCINQKKVEKSLTNLYSYYREIEKEENFKTKTRTKKIYRYIELKEILKKESKKKEITNIDYILDKVLDDDIKRLCLEYIYSHNEKYYEELYQEYSYKSENPIKKYISYFNTLGINFLETEEQTQKQIMAFSLEILKNQIKQLPNISFDKNILIAISSRNSLPVIEELNKLLKTNYIDLALLSMNQNIYCDENIFKNLKANIRTLEKSKVNIRELENKQILLTSNAILSKNLELLKKLDISLKGLNNLDMLAKEDLVEEISLLVEIGFETELVKQPALLNSDKNLVKRILISESVGEDIYDNGYVKESIINKDSFFVSDNEVDQYLFDRDNSNYHSNRVIIFEENSKSPFSYDIEGIKVPKLKVENLSISLKNLVCTSMYSKEEIKVLEKHSKNK
jgi:hypothetical protein